MNGMNLPGKIKTEEILMIDFHQPILKERIEKVSSFMMMIMKISKEK
jgi:hypothetical protein